MVSEEEGGPPTVTLRGVAYPCEASPLSVVYGHDLLGSWVAHGRQSGHRLGAAALALACPRLARRIQRAAQAEDGTEHPGAGSYDEASCDPIVYGGRVLAALLARGVSRAEVDVAGDIAGAWLMTLTRGATEDEVSEVEGNSEPTPSR